MFISNISVEEKKIKKYIFIILVAVLLVSVRQSSAIADSSAANEVLFNALRDNCERKFIKCFTISELAEAVIEIVQTEQTQEAIHSCIRLCNDDSGLRSKRCSDGQCEERCVSVSHIVDFDIMTLISERDFKGLNGICR